MEDNRLSNIKNVINDNSLITLSWGIYDLEMSKDVIQFYVNGLKFQGQVIIKITDNKSLSIILKNDNQCYTLISNVNNMIKDIDEIIEHSDNYYEIVTRNL